MKNSLHLILFVLFVGCATQEELTPSYLNPNLTYGSVTDCSGNSYATIEIGNQEWMAENLRTTCYANGEPISNVTDNTQWENLTTGGWAHYNNDSQYETQHGKLYNWYAATDSQNVCPIGWHAPTNDDWIILEESLGGIGISANAGGKMKTIGAEYWPVPNDGATNESGFSGIHSPSRNPNGWFNEMAYYGAFWSSTDSISNGGGWSRALTSMEGGLIRSRINKGNGFSIRCVKD